MPLPHPIRDVPRERVHEVVEQMLWSEAVADVFCEQQDDGRYTVVPRPRRPAAVAMRAAARRPASRRKVARTTRR